MTSKDYDWFVKADMEKYRGEYVIIRNKRVIVSGENLSEALKKFKKKYPKAMPTITKIPKDDILVLVILCK